MKNLPKSRKTTSQKFKSMFQFSMIGLVFVCVFVLLYSCSSGSKNKLDLENVELIQYETPADDAPVVVFETTMGTYKAVLYPDEVPDYCQYFIGLVNDGYYDDTYIFAVEDSVYFMGGTKTDTGVDNSDTEATDYERELSPNLWPFKGSLVAYGNESGMFNKITLAGSRIMFVNSIEFTDELISELESADGNPDVVSAFKEHGGIPNFSQQYTIFGQVYDGMDVYDEICSVDVEDSDTKKPLTEIKFTKVYMSTYGNNKQSDESSTADDSSDSTSSEDISSQ